MIAEFIAFKLNLCEDLKAFLFSVIDNSDAIRIPICFFEHRRPLPL